MVSVLVAVLYRLVVVGKFITQEHRSQIKRFISTQLQQTLTYQRMAHLFTQSLLRISHLLTVLHVILCIHSLRQLSV